MADTPTPNRADAQVFSMLDHYSQHLIQFIRHPSEQTALGAAALFRLVLDGVIDLLRSRYSQLVKAESPDAPILNTMGMELRSLRGQVSRCLHYQAFRFAPGVPEHLAAEQEQHNCAASAPGAIIASVLGAFRQQLPALSKAMGWQQLINQTKHFRRLVRDMAVDPQPLQALHAAFDDPGEPLLAELCQLVGQDKQDQPLQCITTAAAARIIAEKAAHLMIWRHDEDKGRSVANMAAPELKDYLTILQRLPGATRSDELFYSRKAIEIIQREANRLLDWNWDKSASAQAADAAQQAASVPLLQDNTALLCQMIVIEPLPPAVKALILSREKNISDLKTRYRRSHRWNVILTAVTAVTVPVLLAAAIWAGVTYIPRTGCYSDYVWIDGMPQGIFQLSPGQCDDQVHYELTTVNRRVVSLRRIDAGGRVANELLDVRQDRPAQFIIDYENRSRIIALDEENAALFSMNYSSDMASITYRHPDTEAELYLPADMTDFNVYTWTDRSGSAYQEIASRMYYRHVDAFTENGQEKVVSFRQADETHTDLNGLAAMEYSYDSHGRVEKILYRYDSFLLEDEDSTLPALAEDRLISRAFHYEGPLLVLCEELFANQTMLQHRYVYDEAGNCTRQYFTDSQGSLIENSLGIAEYVTQYENGRPVYSAFLTADGSLTPCEDGYCASTSDYDGQGRLIRTTRLNEKSEKVTGMWAVSEYRYESNLTSHYYLNAAGELMMTTGGYAIAVTEQNDNVTITRYYDKDNNMVLRNTGAYQFRRTIEENGNLSRVDWLDQNGNLMCCYDGYATSIFRYNGSLLMQCQWLDAQGNPVDTASGYCGVEYSYNAKRQLEKSLYTYASGICPEGYNLVVQRYHPSGQMERIGYFMEEHGVSTPVINTRLGYAAVTYSYEEDSVLQQFYDEQGNRILSAQEGCAGYLERTDDKGRVIYQASLDVDNQPMYNQAESFSSAEFRYDPISGKHLSTLYTLSTNPEPGSEARQEVFYSGNGLESKRVCLDVQGNVVVGKSGFAYRYIYRKGNQRWLEYRDVNDQRFISDSIGYCLKHTIYDERDRPVEWYFLDTDVKPIISPQDGYAGIRQEYDQWGNLTRWTYLDADKQPMPCPDLGSATIQQIHNEKGQIIEEAHYDAQGNLWAPPSYGYARIEWSFNADGSLALTTHYDDQNRLIIPDSVSSGGFRTEYDDAGRPLVLAYYDESGSLALHPGKAYAVLRYQYNEEGRMTEEAYYDQYNRLTVVPEKGYAVLRLAYLDDHAAWWAYYGADDQPICHPEYGYAALRQDYDQWGNCVYEGYFDQNDQPMLHPEYGYAYFRAVCSGPDQFVEVHYYDELGNEITDDE